MKGLDRLAATATYALAVSAMLLLSGSKYDWMAELDADLSAGSIETSGNRTVIRTLLLAVALASTAFIAMRGKTRDARLTSLVLSVLAVIAYLFA